MLMSLGSEDIELSNPGRGFAKHCEDEEDLNDSDN